MIYRFFLFILFFGAINIYSFCQPKGYFEHYGTENGLPQHTVMSILQDKKGFIWFSTWDGLCKFDGYNFYSYKIQQGDIYHMRTNRIDFICEDKYGNIWTLPYDQEPHRFCPRTESFMGIRSNPEYKDYTFTAKKIIPTSSGKVWLLSDKMGCVCVIDSTFRVELYNIDNKKIQANKVHNIHEDKEMNTWILTNNGLYSLSPDRQKINNIFSEKDNSKSRNTQDFFCSHEFEDEIWFGSDNGRIWIYNKEDEQFELLKTPFTSGVKYINTINDNQILISSQNDGFCIYSRSDKSLKKYDIQSLKGMKSDKIISSYIDKSKNIWFELDVLGVSKFNPYTQEIKHFELNIESAIINVFPPNYFIFEDKENRLWIHPRGGGFAYYDSRKDKLIPFYNEPSSSDWKFSNLLHAGFSDMQGNLWLSTRSHGLEKIIFNNDVFKSAIVDPNINSTINNDIRAIVEDHKQNLWISTKGGKIYIYNPENVQSGYICNDGTVGTGRPLEGITYCMLEDKDRNMWIGTKGEGVYKLTPTGANNAYKISRFKNIPYDLYSLSDNSVYSIFQDKNGKIWVGTYGGGLNLFEDKDGGRFINQKNNLKNYPTQFGSQIRIISSDKYGNICVGTTLGLIMFSPDFKSPGEIEYKSYIRIPGNNESISGNDIYDICTTKSGETYIATFGGGVNKIEETDSNGLPVSFTPFTTKDGLPSDVILTITEDNDNKLWIATEGNLTKFNPKNVSFETYSEVNRLIEGKNFSEGAKFTTQAGIVYFGFSKGFISINPDKVKDNTYKPYVALTKLQIANKNVSIGDDSPLKVGIDNIKYLKLNHKQNFFSIEFAALDYIDPKRVSYLYKLDGFDEDWVLTNKQRIANYTNMAPGKYTFRVKSTNSDGIWMDNEHTLDIEITPSFWQTKWAYSLYFIVIVLVLYIVLRTIFIFYRLRDKVRLEHEQTEMKTRFFTDISHEIRTPLTMIVSPVENIVENEKTPDDIKYQLQLVLKNANRMLRMVNQILDFRKIQKQKLNVQETAIGKYISDICDNFSKTAEAEGINLRIENNIGNERIWVDRDSIEKLVFNLLSNAIKYTPVGKAIEVYIYDIKKDNVIVLEVRDEGKGMSKEIQNKLFTRFASFNKDRSKPSTGIGLSIVKEVADRHHAKIQVDSDEGKGSRFTVSFPKGIEHFKNDENVVYTHYEINIADEKPVVPENKENLVVEKEEKNDEQKYLILVVEDDSDLREFIVKILSPYYDVLEAENGIKGYETASKHLPDFILSDIMMPESDGVDLLQKIRANKETSHIPVILLSAKTDMESKLSGLDYGADDYITKPFSVKYLRARIENIIEQRKRLYNIYANEKKSESLVSDEKADSNKNKITFTPQDELFIKKIREVVEKNIDDSNFLIDDLAATVAMSRTVFFKKIKSLTGLAPIDFIRDIKIKHAADLLKTQQYTVKEVSYMIGISDTKYFAQCFKKVYNMTPSEYKNSK